MVELVHVASRSIWRWGWEALTGNTSRDEYLGSKNVVDNKNKMWVASLPRGPKFTQWPSHSPLAAAAKAASSPTAAGASAASVAAVAAAARTIAVARLRPRLWVGVPTRRVLCKPGVPTLVAFWAAAGMAR
jgi:hypothetical protein